MNHKPTPLTDKFLFDLKSKIDSKDIYHKKLADDIGIPPQHLYQWFKGLAKPSSEYLLKIQEWMTSNL